MTPEERDALVARIHEVGGSQTIDEWRKAHPNERLDLRGANLEVEDLIGANLEGANLSGVDLSGADLRGANLEGASLYGANLRGANLGGASLNWVNLEGASLKGVNLDGTGITPKQLAQSGGFYGATGIPLEVVDAAQALIKASCVEADVERLVADTSSAE